MFSRKDKPFCHQNILAAASTYSHTHPARVGSLESLLWAYKRACREPKGELQMPQTRGPEKTGRLPSRGTEGRGPPPAPAGGPGRLSDPSFRLSLRPDQGFLHPCRLLLEKSSGPIAGKIRCHTLDAFPSALSADSVFKGSVLYRKEVGPLDPSLCQYNQVGPVFSPGSIMIYTDMRSCLQAWDTS